MGIQGIVGHAPGCPDSPVLRAAPPAFHPINPMKMKSCSDSSLSRVLGASSNPPALSGRLSSAYIAFFLLWMAW
eukprot:1151734-Pelagomonas_calceolata.AAC.2